MILSKWQLKFSVNKYKAMCLVRNIPAVHKICSELAVTTQRRGEGVPGDASFHSLPKRCIQNN